MKKSYIFILTSLLWASVSSAGLLYTYSQLTLKDLDQMNDIVKKKVKEYKKEHAMEILREGVQAVYSRPNDDGMIEKIIQPLRNELEEQDHWEIVIDDLVKEALGALGNPKAFKPVVQNTYGIFLENLIADFKPYADKEGYERKVLERIRDAKVDYSKEAINERKLRTMSNHKSPSEIAGQILSDIANKAEVEAKAKKAQDEEAAKKKK